MAPSHCARPRLYGVIDRLRLGEVLGSTPRSAPSSLPMLHGSEPSKPSAPAAARQSVLKPLTMPRPRGVSNYLDQCMRDHGGFEGNAQSLRIVSRLEKKEAVRF